MSAVHDEHKPFTSDIIISLLIVYFILTLKGCFHFQVSEQWVLILRSPLFTEDIFRSTSCHLYKETVEFSWWPVSVLFSKQVHSRQKFSSWSLFHLMFIYILFLKPRPFLKGFEHGEIFHKIHSSNFTKVSW